MKSATDGIVARAPVERNIRKFEIQGAWLLTLAILTFLSATISITLVTKTTNAFTNEKSANMANRLRTAGEKI